MEVAMTAYLVLQAVIWGIAAIAFFCFDAEYLPLPGDNWRDPALQIALVIMAAWPLVLMYRG
jgi:hypothetical protein